MAWTYFTTLLTGARPITKAERDELYDAVEERRTSAGGGTADYYSVPPAIIASRLITDMMLYDDGSATFLVSMIDVLRTIATRYMRKDRLVGPAILAYGTTGFGYVENIMESQDLANVAGASLGYSSALISSLILNRTTDDVRRWNLIWTMINLLVARLPFSFSTGNYLKHGDSFSYVHDPDMSSSDNSDAAWALAVSNFISSSPTGPSGSGGAGTATSRTGTEFYEIDSEHSIATVIIPAAAPFTSGYQFGGWRVTRQDSSPAAFSGSFDGVGFSASVSANVGFMERLILLTGLTGTGNKVYETRYDFYDSGTGASALRPVEVDGTAVIQDNFYTFIFVVPNFTHV